MEASRRFSLLALDLDGTLTNSQKEITPVTRKAIHDAIRSGVQIVLASGRPIVGIAHVACELKLDSFGGFVLANNGSKIVEWRTKKVVYESVLTKAVVKKVCDATHRFNGLTALAYDETFLYSEDISARYVEKERYNNSAHAIQVDNLERSIDWDPNKMMIVGEPHDISLALRPLQQLLEGLADVFLSEPFFIEVTPQGVHKDAALRLLLDHLNIPSSKMMACGDGLNDIPMLKVAGFAVAMENAYSETKVYADWIAPSNDNDGVAEAIKKYILNH